MTLIVEDGTGLANADSFVSLEYCNTYCDSLELNDWINGSNDPEAAIRRATNFLCNSFTWKGTKVNGREQSLAFPRDDVEDEEGLAVSPATVPFEIKNATCLLAAYEMANPGGLTPSVILANRVKSERIGPIAVEYVTGGTTVDEFKPILSSVEDMVSGLTAAGSQNDLSGTVARS